MTRSHFARLLTGTALLLVSIAACGDGESGPGKHRLVFTAAPVGGDWGATLAIQPVLTIVDDDDLVVDTATASVHLTLIGGAGAVLSDTTSVIAAGGVATFIGLSIDRPAENVRLVASAPGLVSDTSDAFTIGGLLPDHLVFITQPDSLSGGQADSLPVTVEVHTAAGGLVPWYQGVATLAKAPGSPNGSMVGLLSDSVRNGTVSFLGVTIDTAGAGYRLVVNATGVAADTTAPFMVKVGRMSTKSIWAIFGGPVVVVGDTVQFFLSPRDLGGNRVSLNVDSLMMHRVGGTSDGTFTPWEDTGVGFGPYRSTFTATTPGTPVRFLISESLIPGPTTPGTLTVNP